MEKQGKMNGTADCFTCFAKGNGDSPLVCLLAQAIHKVHAKSLYISLHHLTLQGSSHRGSRVPLARAPAEIQYGRWRNLTGKRWLSLCSWVGFTAWTLWKHQRGSFPYRITSGVPWLSHAHAVWAPSSAYPYANLPCQSNIFSGEIAQVKQTCWVVPVEIYKQIN